MAADKQQVPKYVTPYKYAKICGVSATAINNRINNKQLEVVDLENPIDGTVKRYIDTEKYPPAQTIAEMRNYPIESQRWGKKKE
ncbi:hypothetical protein CLV24_105153 [Pontibacter ummariensis]|uniref:Uncharacterized protein n=1 Tax=Pontibacter ummariensis TaxID=1610492 RepID=A0A239DRG2_9BACT|nr:hypothetical protein [Pontibacter ummariensis]PRY13783.1 hypothetical protein CLV24_105153 [Pontibacter ummariensis]SNS35215.1 hypothetical protein SAMN06296052_10599 [Pontibacter ummariensis]